MGGFQARIPELLDFERMVGPADLVPFWFTQRITLLIDVASRAGFCEMPTRVEPPAEARDDAGHTILHWAALAGDGEMMTWLLERGAEPEAEAANQQTPLYCSASGKAPDSAALSSGGAFSEVLPCSFRVCFWVRVFW